MKKKVTFTRGSNKPLFILTKPNKFANGGLVGLDKIGTGKSAKYATDISGKINELAQTKSQNLSQSAEDLSSVTALSSNEDLLNNFSDYGNYDLLDSQEFAIDTSRGAAKNSVKGNGIIGKGTTTGLSAGVTIGSAFGPIGGAIGGAIGAVAGTIGGIFSRRSKIKKTQKENKVRQDILNQNTSLVNQEAQAAKDRTSKELTNQISNLSNRNMKGLLSNYAAYGGNFPSINTYAEGGEIHIEPSKRGTFTAAATKHGKSVQGFASQVLSNKDNYSSSMVKKANFARNASKWQHQYGGLINSINQFGIGGNLNTNTSNESTHGATFTNGITSINNGNTHENNPLGGVPISIGQNGEPNMVEEGEVKYKDYIFSNRISPNKKDLKKSNMSEKLNNYSFAKLAERENKESSERPNDNISRKGLEASLNRLKVLQDNEKQRKGLISDPNSFKVGGKITGNIGSKTPNLDFKAPSLNTNFNNTYSPSTKSSIFSTPNLEGVASGVLRLAPIIASGIGAFSKQKEKTFEPNYEPAETLSKGNKKVSYSPIGNYMKYTPLDTQRDINTLNSVAGANRQAIAQASGNNRGQYIAGVLASDRMATDKLGDIRRAATESDLNQRMQVESFNRGTNMANSDMELKASMANSESSLRTAMASSQLRQQAFDSARALNYQEYLNAEAARGANITNFANNLGELGRELVGRKSINSNPALKYSNSFSGLIKYKK